jgi:hypothetical protein
MGFFAGVIDTEAAGEDAMTAKLAGAPPSWRPSVWQSQRISPSPTTRFCS